MAFKIGDRIQSTFLPTTIDDYVGSQDPVRVYDAFVDSLDFNQLEIPLIPNPGAERYDPKKMLKLIIYGYSYGTRSSRLMEKACHHNLSFIWLMAGLKPDHRTIGRFRGDNKEAIKKVLKQCIRMCIDMKLVDGNTLFIDGSKFRANASIGNTISRQELEKEIANIEEHIEELVNEVEDTDKKESHQFSLVEVQEKIADQKQLAQRMKEFITKMDADKTSTINTVDPDAVKAKSRQGTHAFYNVQCVTDKKHGLIVQAEAVSAPNDFQQLKPQMEQAADNIGHQPQQVCTDAGFFSPTQIATIDPVITVIMPSPRQTHEERRTGSALPTPFDKSHFQYDKERDQYICPTGKLLTHQGVDGERPHRHVYQAKPADCQKCPHWGTCTSAKRGRKIIRSEHEDIIKRQEAIYKLESNQATYRLRKQYAEHPFGHFKRNLNAGQFLLRGRKKVNAEVSILATCFNITRMMTIIGIGQLIPAFKGI
jgi:transposase